MSKDKMKKSIYTNNNKFSLFWYMGDILDNFYDKNGLDHKCGNETLYDLISLDDRNAKTEKQIKWLKRWNRIYELVDYREEERGNPSWTKNSLEDAELIK